jgi:hypothetical protein
LLKAASSRGPARVPLEPVVTVVMPPAQQGPGGMEVFLEGRRTPGGGGLDWCDQAPLRDGVTHRAPLCGRPLRHEGEHEGRARVIPMAMSAAGGNKAASRSRNPRDAAESAVCPSGPGLESE